MQKEEKKKKEFKNVFIIQMSPIFSIGEIEAKLLIAQVQMNTRHEISK